MIASFSKNFVFIRTRKTASTSTEIVLGSWCSDGDIVTPLGPEDEIIRLEFGGRPMNFSHNSELESFYRSSLSSKDIGIINPIYRQLMNELKYHHHMGASEAAGLLPEKFWETSFKFAFDRNPYEKVVSLSYWRKKNAIKAGAAVEDFLDEVIDGAEYRNYDLYTINGRLAVDRVFDYENLKEHLSFLAQSLGGALPPSLPNSKGQHRKDRRSAYEILSLPQRSRVFDICQEEFQLLGYSR
jgi:hypothetical protein